MREREKGNLGEREREREEERDRMKQARGGA